MALAGAIPGHHLTCPFFLLKISWVQTHPFTTVLIMKHAGTIRTYALLLAASFFIEGTQADLGARSQEDGQGTHGYIGYLHDFDLIMITQNHTFQQHRLHPHLRLRHQHLPLPSETSLNPQPADRPHSHGHISDLTTQ